MSFMLCTNLTEGSTSLRPEGLEFPAVDSVTWLFLQYKKDCSILFQVIAYDSVLSPCYAVIKKKSFPSNLLLVSIIYRCLRPCHYKVWKDVELNMLQMSRRNVVVETIDAISFDFSCNIIYIQFSFWLQCRVIFEHQLSFIWWPCYSTCSPTEKGNISIITSAVSASHFTLFNIFS